MIFDNFNQLKEHIPGTGRLMAIDVGTKRIGIAVSDENRMIATPKTTINRKGNNHDFEIIKGLISENKITAIIVGLPVNMDESENEMTGFSKRFVENLDKFLEEKEKLCYHDERLTSFMAKDDLISMVKGKKDKKNKVIDQMAASLILQSILDSQ